MNNVLVYNDNTKNNKENIFEVRNNLSKKMQDIWNKYIDDTEQEDSLKPKGELLKLDLVYKIFYKLFPVHMSYLPIGKKLEIDKFNYNHYKDIFSALPFSIQKNLFTELKISDCEAAKIKLNSIIKAIRFQPISNINKETFLTSIIPLYYGIHLIKKSNWTINSSEKAREALEIMYDTGIFNEYSLNDIMCGIKDFIASTESSYNSFNDLRPFISKKQDELAEIVKFIEE